MTTTILLYAILGLTALLFVLVVLAVIQGKAAKPKQNNLLAKLGRALDPSKPKTRAALFVALFAIFGSGYMAYNAFATAYYTSGTCTSHVWYYGTGYWVNSYEGGCVHAAQYLTFSVLGYGFYSNGTYEVDGYYGNYTVSHVKAVQKLYGLGVDGEIGPQTWGLLCRNVLHSPYSTAAAKNWAHYAGCY